MEEGGEGPEGGWTTDIEREQIHPAGVFALTLVGLWTCGTPVVILLPAGHVTLYRSFPLLLDLSDTRYELILIPTHDHYLVRRSRPAPFEHPTGRGENDNSYLDYDYDYDYDGVQYDRKYEKHTFGSTYYSQIVGHW